MIIPNIRLAKAPKPTDSILFISKDRQKLSQSAAAHAEYVAKRLALDHSLLDLNFINYQQYFIELKGNHKHFEVLENLRRTGANTWFYLKRYATKTLQITDLEDNPQHLLAYLEGLLLGAYTFDKYKNHKSINRLQEITLISSNLAKKDLKDLLNLIEGVYLARDLVNEPYNILNVEAFSAITIESSKKYGFDVEVYPLDKIKELKMGGILAVNRGSKKPAQFLVLEYLPDDVYNTYPYIFVGKGVVYDTGGLSLKKTKQSMDFMKCDMAGAATVLALLQVAAKNELPLHLVGLIPLTDNWPGENALAPGDIITMLDGTTVEVLNTDAEGRLILADALTFAKPYKPELVCDFATLTGGAIQAIGHEGTPYMAKVPVAIKNDLENSGRNVYERLVELPLWNEYGKYLKSDVADLKNVGGDDSKSIIAAKFLQHFTSYPWVHFDIAGTAYLRRRDNYRGLQGTGVGVRLMYNFLAGQVKKYL